MSELIMPKRKPVFDPKPVRQLSQEEQIAKVYKILGGDDHDLAYKVLTALGATYGNNILVAIDEINDSSDTGFTYITDDQRERLQLLRAAGHVIGIGPLVSSNKITGQEYPWVKNGHKLQLGDRIMFRQYGGTDICLNQFDHQPKFRYITDDDLRGVTADGVDFTFSKTDAMYVNSNPNNVAGFEESDEMSDDWQAIASDKGN